MDSRQKIVGLYKRSVAGGFIRQERQGLILAYDLNKVFTFALFAFFAAKTYVFSAPPR